MRPSSLFHIMLRGYITGAFVTLVFLCVVAVDRSEAWIRGSVAANYKPPLPAPGIPCAAAVVTADCDFVVGYTSSGPTQVTLNPDTSCLVCPPNVSKAAGEAFYRVNGSFSNYTFAGVGYPLNIQNPNVVISQTIFDLTNWGTTNLPVVRTTVAGAYYSLVNVTADGGSGANVTAFCTGAALLVENTRVTNWPNDWCDPSPISVRTNTKSLVSGLCQTGMSGGLPTGVSFGITVTSRPHFNFYCTTGGACVTAGSEPAQYSTAIDGEVVTDGTCSFTTSSATHKVRYNYVAIISTVVGLHGDGVQVAATSSTGQMSSGADWEWYNIVIDGSNVVGPGTFNNAVNWCSGFAAPADCVWSVNATFRDSILKGAAPSFLMSWGCNSQCTVTGSATYTNLYVSTAGAGVLYSNQPVAPNLAMSNIFNVTNGNTVSFDWNNGGVVTTVTQIP